MTGIGTEAKPGMESLGGSPTAEGVSELVGKPLGNAKAGPGAEDWAVATSVGTSIGTEVGALIRAEPQVSGIAAISGTGDWFWAGTRVGVRFVA